MKAPAGLLLTSAMGSTMSLAGRGDRYALFEALCFPAAPAFRMLAEWWPGASDWTSHGGEDERSVSHGDDNLLDGAWAG